MQDESKSLVEALNTIWGGGLTTLVAAAAGRLAWHGQEVRAGRRSQFGRDLFWELPVAIGMAFVAEGLAAYLDLPQTVTTALAAALAYLGPKGAVAVIEHMIARRK
jgi:hypothetical protein